jgi:hypothetical protein
LREALERAERIGNGKRRDREHVRQIASLLPGLEMPFLRLMHAWSVHLAAAEAEAKGWILFFRTKGFAAPQDRDNYRDFERRMLVQSREFIRQLSLMQDHSPALRRSGAARSFIAHVVQEAQRTAALLEREEARPAAVDDTAAAGASAAPAQAASPGDVRSHFLLPAVRFVLKRKAGGGWSLVP